MDDARFMHRCLELASLGRGAVGNGALVGSVLVRKGEIIAEAYYSHYGALHAEASLLERFTDPIEPEDILYVSLEPCCHHGKTPPCTDAILRRGIRHVVFGMIDPDPRVAGKGIERLRSQGVDVQGPVLRANCEYLNRGFVSVRKNSRPWITLKMAYSRAGMIYKPDGSPLKITSNKQDVWSHTYLRSNLDGVIVGYRTVQNDDPSLNTRFAQKMSPAPPFGMNTKIDQSEPWRIVFDASARAPYNSKLFHDSWKKRTMLVVGMDLTADARSRVDRVADQGVRVVSVPLDADSRFVWGELWRSLLTPDPASGYFGLTSLLVEGGPTTAATFRNAGMLDEDITLIGSA